MKIARKAGATSQIMQVFIRDSSSTTGAGLTGLAFGTGSLTAYYHRDTDTTATVINLVTMTVGTYTSSGFKEIDATNMPGWYQLCVPDAAFASGAASVGVHLKGATNMAPLPIEVDLAAQVDVTKWLGTTVTAATAGIPDVNTKNVNNVSAGSVTTINANLGITQPINFTGTAGSALVKADMVDIAGAAVSASTAQLGVNIVNVAGSPSAAAAGYVAPDWNAIHAPTTTVDLSGTTIKNLDGNTVQTGDAYARLGAPAGASISADIAAVESGVTGLPSAGTIASTVLTTAMTESYPTVGATFSLAQGLYNLVQRLGQMSITSTTMSVKKRNGSTTAKTYTLNSATAPTNISEQT